MPALLGLEDILPTMVANQRRFGNPLGLERSKIAGWASGLEFSGSSRTFLYSGGLYQMGPYIDSFVGALERLESGAGGSTGLELVRVLGKMGVNVASLYSSLAGVDPSRGYRVLRKAYTLLRGQGLEFGYLGTDEDYCGVLFYDVGADEEFAEVAAGFAHKLKERGVKRLITVDPHSTVVLRDVYPKYVEGFDVDVKHYLEVLDFGRLAPLSPQGSDVYAVHDPCLLARNLGLSERFREFASRVGLRLAEPQFARRNTFCCGGPIENVAPKVAGAVAARRCEQLGRVSGRVVVSCPICLSNLGRTCGRKGGLQVFDVLEATVR